MSRLSYFDRVEEGPLDRLDEILALQRGVIGRRVHLIASASYPFDSVLRALAEPSFVLPAEGMPHERYLPGAEVMDKVEDLGEELTLDLFGNPEGYRATIQPHSGTQANQMVFNSSLMPNDSVLRMRPADGGHISHTILISRRHPTVGFGLNSDGTVDYDDLRSKALLHRPRLIIVGGSSLTRSIDFAACGEIAREVGSFLHADISHTATFVAAGIHPSPFPHADFVTFNMVKNLRGPNGGILLYRSKYEKDVSASVFPLTQGGANETGMLGKLACLLEWRRQNIRNYATQIVKNAEVMGAALAEAELRLVTGGTDSHMLMVDLRDESYSGADLEHSLEDLGILANRNLVPGDRRPPRETSGLRLGLANTAILGYSLDDIRILAQVIARAKKEIGRSDREIVDGLIDKYQRHLIAPVW